MGGDARPRDRLEADYRVRSDGQVQVESWFSEGDKAPAGAKIQVFRANGDVLTQGTVDEKGIFVFAPKVAEDLRIVVSAGAGHRAEFRDPGVYTAAIDARRTREAVRRLSR